MSIWRDAQEQAEQIRKQNRWKKVRVLGVDGAYVLGWGKKRQVLVGVDRGMDGWWPWATSMSMMPEQYSAGSSR